MRSESFGTGSRFVPEEYDLGDRLMMALVGAKRARTPRLAELLAATRREAERVLCARRRDRLPLEGVGRGFLWRRSGGRWRLLETCDLAAGNFFSHNVADAAAMSVLDAVQVIGDETGRPAPPRLLAGDVVRLFAVDLRRRRMSMDHVAVVDAHGGLSALELAVSGRWAGAAS